jgi:hypothetical protein
MSNGSGGALRSVAWQELLPWLRIVRALRMALSPRALLLAAAGFLATLLAWAFFAALFTLTPPAERWLGFQDAPAPLDVAEARSRNPLRAIDSLVPDRPPLLDRLSAEPPSEVLEALGAVRPSMPLDRPLPWVWRSLSGPVWAALRLEATPADLACLLLCGISSVAIWGLFGGAISRMAAVELACDERVGLFAALRYAAGKWLSYFGAPLLPVLGIALAAAPIWLLGWLMRADVGLLVVGLLWAALLALGFVMMLLMVGLLFGWPLMWAAISTEGTDSFDALSRSYAYVFQRPLRYGFYVLVAALLGWLGWIVVENFAAGVVWLTYWAASWSGGAERVGQVLAAPSPLEGVARGGAALVGFWAGLVKLLAVAYLFSYFWTAMTAVYLVLRRDVDATEMDEVFLDADRDEQSFDLPTLGTDQAGAPELGEKVAPEAGPQPPESPQTGEPEIHLPDESSTRPSADPRPPIADP